MNILDGKMVSKKIHEEVKVEVSKLSKKPCLLVILVGDDQASQIYVSSKEKACKKVGMISKTIILDKNSSQKQVIDINPLTILIICDKISGNTIFTR